MRPLLSLLRRTHIISVILPCSLYLSLVSAAVDVKDIFTVTTGDVCRWL